MNPIIRYVRNSFGDPIGCVVAIEDDNDMGFSIGWSQCNPADQFQKKIARQIALYRAKHGCDTDPALTKDEIFGKQPWISLSIYELILDAEEKFLDREVRDILGYTIQAPVV